MTTLFVAMGLIERDGARLRTAAPAREHLVAHSRWYLGPYYPKVADRPIARDLIEILRSGAPARFASRPDQADWHRAMETETFAEEFTAAMNCRGLLTAPALAQQVDLSRPSAAARHRRRLGGFRLCRSPSDSRSCALRCWRRRRSIGLPRARSPTAASADRVDTVVGDMLAEPLPGGYDVHLFSNVLHDWDEDVVRQLLAASAAALRPGGLLIVHDTFLNADQDRPAADRRVLGAADARDPGPLLFGRRDRVVADRRRASAFRGLVPSAIGRSAIVAERRRVTPAG